MRFIRSLARGKRALLYGLASAVVWSAAGIALSRSAWLEGARLFWLDQLFSARQRLGAAPRPSADVVIVGIDEQTRSAFRARHPGAEDRWITRQAIGRLLVALGKAKVKAVGVDFFFDVPLSSDVDDLLASALAGDTQLGTGGLDAVLACFLTVSEQKRPLASLRPYAAEGNVIIQPDVDGKFRRLRPGVVFQGVPLFCFQACCLFVAGPEGPGQALWHNDRDDSLELPGHFRVPAEMLIDFVGPAQTFEMLGQQFSAIDVLDGRVDGEKLRGKLVLVGPTLRNADRFSVPVGPSRGDPEYRRFFEKKYGVSLSQGKDPSGADLLRSGAMSGVEIHANAVSQILQGRYLRQAGGELPWLMPALIAAVLVGGGWVFWHGASSGRHRLLRSVAASTAWFAVVLIGAAGASLWLFVGLRVFIPLELLAAWVGQASCGIVFSTMQLRRQNRKIERMYGSAVGQELLDYITAHPEIMTQTQRRVATVLFCDIRGFTPLTEKLQPDEVVAVLREHFQTLWAPLAEGGAWVDKYVGDLVMAGWNVLQPMDDHALRGVRAAVGMKIAMAELNCRRARQGQAPIEVGIGLHSGELVGGNVGSEKRSNFTLIGDTVNLASRIENEARGGEILISEATWRQTGGRVVARALEPTAIRGKSGLYQLYEVLGLLGGPTVPGKERQAADIASRQHRQQDEGS